MACLDENVKMLLQTGWRMLCLGTFGFPAMSESCEPGACSLCEVSGCVISVQQCTLYLAFFEYWESEPSKSDHEFD